LTKVASEVAESKVSGKAELHRIEPPKRISRGYPLIPANGIGKFSLLVCRVGNFELRKTQHVLILGAGILAESLCSSTHSEPCTAAYDSCRFNLSTYELISTVPSPAGIRPFDRKAVRTASLLLLGQPGFGVLIGRLRLGRFLF